jgi:hypothetical protein
MPFRVELEMHPRFLNHYKIKGPYEFNKLVEILPGKHVLFVRLDRRKLTTRLRRLGFNAEERRAVLEVVTAMDGDLWPTLNYLREEVGMENARRLVEPVDMNGALLEALQKWAAIWPKPPKRLDHK